MSLLLHQKDCILSPLGIFCLKTLVSLLSIPGSYLLWLSCHQSQSLSTPFDYLNYLLVKYMGEMYDPLMDLQGFSMILRCSGIWRLYLTPSLASFVNILWLLKYSCSSFEA